MEIKEPSQHHYHHHYLTKDDILAIIRDDDFQKSLKTFSTPKSHSYFRAIGFTIAIAAGLFGYYLKADSEADDRRADVIHRRIEEKRDWMIKTLQASIELRKTRFEIEHECKYKKPLTSYEQIMKRYIARDNLIKAFSGITEVFDIQVYNSFVKLISFDTSIKDVCAKNAPVDEEWRKLLITPTVLMRDSIQKDREELKKLENNFFSKI